MSDSLEVLVIERRMEVCPEHGEFTSEHHVWGKILDFWTGCPKCAAQQKLKEREEEKRRQQEQWIERLLRSAQIPPRFRGKGFDDYKASGNGERLALSVARGYAEGFKDNLAAGRCLVLCGKVGTGKTHLACAIATAVARLGGMVLYQTASGLIRQIRATWARETTPLCYRTFGSSIYSSSMKWG